MTNSNDSSTKRNEPSRSRRERLELRYHALKELANRQRTAPLLFYTPHRRQKEFHSLGVTKRRRLMLGANRSGKSHGGGNEALAHALGYWYWKVPNLELTEEGHMPPRDAIDPKYWVRRIDGIPVRVPNTGMTISGLPRKLGIGEVLYPKIFDLLPQKWKNPKLTKVIKGPGSVPDSMVLPNGSKILFASGEQDDLSFEGFTLDWAWIDEPVRQAIYNGLWARLTDYRGPVWITMTPLGPKCAWLYSSWYLDQPDDVGIVNCCQDDNPFLSDDIKKEFAENGEWSESERRARLYGTFEFIGSRVFELFDPTVHVIDPRPIPSDWTRVLSVDPHSKRPAFMVWLAHNPHTGQWIVYREWPTENFFKLTGGARTPAEYAAIIRNSEGRERVSTRVCDPRYGKSSFTVNGVAHTAWAEIMGDYGMDFDPRVPNVARVEYGHQVINDLLRYDKNQPISPANEPRLLVFNTCPNSCEAFLNYAFEDVIKEKINEDFKDPIDAIRYALLYGAPAPDSWWDSVQPDAREFAELNSEDDLYGQNW